MIDLLPEVIGFHGSNHASVLHLLAGDIGQSDQRFEWLGTGFYVLRNPSSTSELSPCWTPW